MDDSELVIIYFDSPEAAQRALATMRGLDAEGFIELEDGVVISKDEAGSLSLPDDGDDEAGRVTFGGVVGLVAGGIVGLPVVGVLAGAGLAAKRKSHADQIGEIVESVGKDMSASSAALALLVRSLSDPETVIDRLGAHRDSVRRVEVPAELREQIDRAVAQEEDGT